MLLAQVAMRIGFSCYSSMILPFSELPDQPEVPVVSGLEVVVVVVVD